MHSKHHTKVHLHVGPANSGKTYDSIEALKKAGSGIYLAPLRLLAWEIADKLNNQGFPCSLLTGEEKVIIPNAPYLSCTVEMYNPDTHGACIVLDEAQMIADSQRGWAWMRVIANAHCEDFQIIASLDAENLLKDLLRRAGFNPRTTRHERLAPLHVAEKPWRIDHPLPDTIFVVFSRAGVLSLKTFFERKGWKVAAIYGNLPPEVKKKQAERFLKREAQICVATDAIGMGMNLPASRVCFTTLVKYDGEKQRLLTPSEARQIGGRAGRFGIKESGEVGAFSHENLNILTDLLARTPPDLKFARISPELADIEKLKGPLAKRLEEWEKRHAVPEIFKELILPADLEQQIALASFIRDRELENLGLEAAFSLIKAPASKNTIAYWWACVRTILEGGTLPAPIALPPVPIESEDMLLAAETTVEQCDIYLWIAHRQGFERFVLEADEVLRYKWSLIDKIDAALAFKSDMRQKCRKCGKNLPVLHQFSICDVCHRRGLRQFFGRPKHKKFRFRKS